MVCWWVLVHCGPKGWGGNWDSNWPTIVATCIHLQLINDAAGYKLQPLQQCGQFLFAKRSSSLSFDKIFFGRFFRCKFEPGSSDF